jgi:hypothetical protein
LKEGLSDRERAADREMVAEQGQQRPEERSEDGREVRGGQRGQRRAEVRGGKRRAEEGRGGQRSE